MKRTVKKKKPTAAELRRLKAPALVARGAKSPIAAQAVCSELARRARKRTAERSGVRKPKSSKRSTSRKSKSKSSGARQGRLL